MQGSLLATKHTTESWINAGALTFGVVIIMPVLLFILGRVLGRLTLSAARWTGLSGHYFAVLVGKLIRWLYRGVIAVAILYFYLSIPALLFGGLTIIGGGGSTYCFSRRISPNI
jgi:hypothetical protein